MTRSLRPIDVYPVTVRTLEVLRIVDVTPGMRRVTLGGPELAAHTAANGYPVAAFRSDGFDDEGKIVLKHPAVDEPLLFSQGAGVVQWPEDREHVLFRTYTVRRWDAEKGEVDLDFVKHGVGPATSWAYSVQPGERVQWLGPKSSATHPEGADWTLIVGDETAMPAIGRWLEEWPDGARGQVFIEVAEVAHRQDLPVPEGVELTWLSRDGAEPGTTTLLLDAIRAAHWWEGVVFAWVAGEALTLTPIRRWLRNEKGLPKEQVEVTGYWRRQEVVIADDSGVQDFDATEDEDEAFHELTELLPGFALRIAATLDLGTVFDGRARTLDEIVSATGADAVGLGKLLRYLTAIRVAEQTDDGRYALTSLGRFLENEYVANTLDLDSAEAQEELGALLSLSSAVRDGRGDHERWFGATFAEAVLASPTRLAARLEHDAEIAAYSAGALALSPALADVGTVALAGRGAGAFAVALVRAHLESTALVIGAPSELEALAALHPTHDRIAYVPGSLLAPLPVGTDTVLLLDVLRSLPDADAVHALRQAAGALTPGGQVLVFGEPLDRALADEHDYEHDLYDFALTGGGARTHDEHLALFIDAGLVVTERSTIGWGNTLYRLTAG